MTLTRRINQINAQQSERHIQFVNWFDSTPFKLMTGHQQRQALADYVGGLLRDIGDLQETVARAEIKRDD